LSSIIEEKVQQLDLGYGVAATVRDPTWKKEFTLLAGGSTTIGPKSGAFRFFTFIQNEDHCEDNPCKGEEVWNPYDVSKMYEYTNAYAKKEQARLGDGVLSYDQVKTAMFKMYATKDGSVDEGMTFAEFLLFIADVNTHIADNELGTPIAVAPSVVKLLQGGCLLDYSPAFAGIKKPTGLSMVHSAFRVFTCEFTMASPAQSYLDPVPRVQMVPAVEVVGAEGKWSDTKVHTHTRNSNRMNRQKSFSLQWC
jgi:hypothetical protein